MLRSDLTPHVFVQFGGSLVVMGTYGDGHGNGLGPMNTPTSFQKPTELADNGVQIKPRKEGGEG